MAIPVLLMSHSLGHGGGERQLALTALSLDPNRFAPHIAHCEGGFHLDSLRDAGLPFFSIGSRSLISRAAFGEALRLRRYIREHGIRIVQTFDYSMNVFGIPVARSLQGVIPLSNLRCRMDLIPQRYRWLNHVAHRISRGIVVNSEALRKHLHEDYQIPLSRIFTCYNGIDTSIYHPAIRPATNSLTIGTVCVLRPEKNIPLLIEAVAAAAVRHPGIRLLIVGSGPEELRLKALAESLGISQICTFQPSTPDVPKFLSTIDIFVLPSLTEGLSNAVMEAMASGCCVLASDVGGNPELIEDGVHGLLFPSQDRQALIDRLLRTIDHGDLRHSLAEAGATRMKSGFSLQSAARCMQSVYEKMLSA